MNTEEKIEAAGKKKEEGNALFKAGKYLRASKRYEKVNIRHANHVMFFFFFPFSSPCQGSHMNRVLYFQCFDCRQQNI